MLMDENFEPRVNIGMRSLLNDIVDREDCGVVGAVDATVEVDNDGADRDVGGVTVKVLVFVLDFFSEDRDGGGGNDGTGGAA